MTTTNGIGTTFYDWSKREDGSAEATDWFVVFFLPVFPLGRSNVRVRSSAKPKFNLLDTITAFFGSGQGFASQIETIEPVTSPFWRIIRTYIFGWVVVPTIAMVGPVGSIFVLNFGADVFDYDLEEDGAWLFGTAGLFGLLWIGVLVSLICDRSAGRFHVMPNRSTKP